MDTDGLEQIQNKRAQKEKEWDQVHEKGEGTDAQILVNWY
jgi:hypothetical protein